MKRFLSLLLVAVMLLSLVVTTMAADQPEVRHPFEDIGAEYSSWATESLNKMYEKGIINGTSPTTFDPEGKFTREMMVTMFWRLEGSEANGATPEQLAGIFTDGASVSDWARQAVLWAYNNNVVSGYPEGDFRPQNVVTRQEAAKFIVNYAQYAGITLPNISDRVLADTPDAWAYDAVYACVRAGIITGDENGYFRPNEETWRIHAAHLMAKLPEKQREIIYSTDPDDPNPTNIGTMNYDNAGVTFTEEVKISEAVVMTDGTSNNQFTATSYGVHGWHESRVLRTKYGTYIVFAQDETFASSHDFASGNGRYIIVTGKFMLVKVTDDGFTKLFEGTYPVHMGSCAPNVLAGEDGMIYVTTLSDNKAYPANEAAFLQIWEYNEITGDEYTSGPSIYDFKLPGKSGYGYYQPIVDTAQGKIYGIFAGGKTEGYITWFIYDLATHQWETTNRVVQTLDRSSYYHAYADGKGGIFFVAQSNPLASSVQARYQAEGYTNVRFSQTGGYIFHALNLFYIPDMYEEEIAVHEVYEPNYADDREFPVDKNGYKSPAGACHYTGGNSYLASNGYLYLIYVTSTSKSGSVYRYAVYDTNTSELKRIKTGILSLATIASSSSYEFVIAENSNDEIYVLAINTKPTDATLEVYKVDFNGTANTLKFNSVIKKSNGGKGSVTINYKGGTDAIPHSRLSFTSTRNGSIQDNIVGIVSYSGSQDGKRKTTFSSHPIYNTITDADYCSYSTATYELYYYAIELPH